MECEDHCLYHETALETLKANTDTVTGKLIENPKSSAWLKTFFPGTLWVTKKYEIEEFTLKVPKDDKDRETDIYNSILLYERLRHLPLYLKINVSSRMQRY